MRSRKYILTLLLQFILVAASAQEYWNGTKSQTSSINRSGQTRLGVLNFRSSGTGTTTVVEHTATTGDLYIRSVASASNGDKGNLILNDAGGSVGIGTSSPHGTLNIMAGNMSNTPLASIILSRYWADSIHTRASAIFHYTDGVKDKLIFSLAGLGGSFNSPLNLAQAKMVIQANGNVGIGTTEPGHKLSVKGVVQATEINVTTTDWADYVFEEGYRLPDLKDVESQIKQTGHLPGMPSAATLEEEGVDLGKMVELQQKKIEELTLYLIKQQKQITQLSSLTQALQKKLTDEHK